MRDDRTEQEMRKMQSSIADMLINLGRENMINYL